MLAWRKPNSHWYRYVHNINSANDKISNSKEKTISITMSIARLDGGITESHGKTRRQHLHFHLQLRSGRLRSGKQVGAHGNLHHLRNGGDFGFLGRIPENRRCRQDTHKQCTYSAVQSLHKRGTHRTRLAQDLQRHLCAPEKNLSSGPHMSHPLLLSHMPCTTSTFSSSFKLPSTTTPEHTIGTTRSTPRTHSASSTSPRTTSRKATPSRTTLSVKISRVAETRATHTPQFWDGRPKAPKGTDKHTW